MLEEDNRLAVRTAQTGIDNSVDGENISIRGDHLVLFAKKASIIDQLSLKIPYIKIMSYEDTKTYCWFRHIIQSCGSCLPAVFTLLTHDMLGDGLGQGGDDLRAGHDSPNMVLHRFK